MSYVIYLYAFKKNKLGYAAAYSVIFFILVGAIAMIQNRLTRSKEVQQ